VLSDSGQVTEIHEDNGIMMGKVNFGASRRTSASLMCPKSPWEITRSSTWDSRSIALTRKSARATLKMFEELGVLNEELEVPMKYMNEFRDGATAQRLAQEIRQITTRPWAIMEVCAAQTHSIIRNGIDQLLPEEIELIHAPVDRYASRLWS